jgi:Uma2 family endonuclease
VAPVERRIAEGGRGRPRTRDGDPPSSVRGLHRSCARPPDAVSATNPVIVVEVLSPQTQAIDTSDKLVDYFRVASIQHYLIVSARRREVIHHRRSGEGIASCVVNLGSIRLDPPGIAIDVAEVYAGLG